MKTKILLCAINSKFVHSSLAPWYLKKALTDGEIDGIEVDIIEATINDDYRSIANRITSNAPDIIGFSCYIWNISHTTKLLQELTRTTNPIVVLGGPEVGFNSTEVLQSTPQADFVISGEGEVPFTELVKALVSKSDYKGIPGLYYREGSEVGSTPLVMYKSDPPNPYSPEYFERLDGRISYFETSRGCPFSCAFCLSGGYQGVRFFDLDDVYRNIFALANSGSKTIKFVDRTFNCNPKRAYQIFGFIINHAPSFPPDVCFHFEIAGDLLDSRTLELLATAPAGLIQFEIGVQSFNPMTLEAIYRKTDVSHLTHNIRQLLKQGNIHLHIDLIAGLPHEGMASFKESFNTAFALRPHMLQLGFLKLLHGAQMRLDPDAFPCEYAKEPPYEVISTPWLTQDELTALHNTEDALERLYNSGRFRRTLDYLFGKLDGTPFDLFYDFGQYTAGKTLRISLNSYIKFFITYFYAIRGVDRQVLRDLLVYDYLATNPSGSLPPILKEQDPELKSRITALNLINPPQKGVRRGFAYLYTKQKLIYADYKDKDPVTGEYEVRADNR